MFGETLVFRRLLDEAATPESRLTLLAENIEGSIATVFRQVAMNRFEELASTPRAATEGELCRRAHRRAAGRPSQEELLGDAVEVTDGYRSWWSYVPHFIGTPGYVYAYAYGQLLALSVYGRYLEEGEAFVPRYLEMLARGRLAQPGGARARSPAWTSPTRASGSAGSTLVRGQLEEAERAAAAAVGSVTEHCAHAVRRAPRRWLPPHARRPEPAGPDRAARASARATRRGSAAAARAAARRSWRSRSRPSCCCCPSSSPAHPAARCSSRSPPTA